MQGSKDLLTKPQQERTDMSTEDTQEFWKCVFREYPTKYIRKTSMYLYTNHPSTRTVEDMTG